MSEAFLLSRLLIEFANDDEDLHGDLSAAAITPDGSLWLGSDELHRIERLRPLQPGVFGAHEFFNLADYVNLPAGEDEIDIEGMDYDDGYLWITGSHSLKRKKPKGKKTSKDLSRLANVKTERNRYLLIRIPLLGDTPLATCSHPERPGEILRAATLQQHGDHNLLMDALRDDEHLGPFLSIPLADKENGFNIEGLTARGQRLFLGLRGPVLDGWACVIEFEVAESDPGVLTMQAAPDNGRPYKKHFLDLDGLGIRELQLLGDDLLILAGPSMHLEGAMKVFRLKDAVHKDADSLSSVEKKDLALLFVLPFVLGADQAEGMALLPCLDQEQALLIVHDDPHPRRFSRPGALYADIYRLPPV